VLRQSYNFDFGCISLCEVIGIVAAYVFRPVMRADRAMCKVKLCTLHDPHRSQNCNFGEAQAKSSLMIVYVNRNILEQLL